MDISEFLNGGALHLSSMGMSMLAAVRTHDAYQQPGIICLVELEMVEPYHIWEDMERQACGHYYRRDESDERIRIVPTVTGSRHTVEY